jgi:hypothetical protein
MHAAPHPRGVQAPGSPEIPLLSEIDKREDAQRRYRLIQEKTRDQSYTLDKLQLHGALTGDPEIDAILIQFKRPADLGAA